MGLGRWRLVFSIFVAFSQVDSGVYSLMGSSTLSELGNFGLFVRMRKSGPNGTIDSYS